MYAGWESRFEEWKKKNENNPDRNGRLKYSSLFFAIFLFAVM